MDEIDRQHRLTRGESTLEDLRGSLARNGVLFAEKASVAKERVMGVVSQEADAFLSKWFGRFEDAKGPFHLGQGFVMAHAVGGVHASGRY